MTCHFAPPSLEFQTSSSPTTTSFALVGSMETYRLYQAWMPGW